MSSEAGLRTRLARTLGSGAGLWGVLTTVHLKIIGRRYILNAITFWPRRPAGDGHAGAACPRRGGMVPPRSI